MTAAVLVLDRPWHIVPVAAILAGVAPGYVRPPQLVGRGISGRLSAGGQFGVPTTRTDVMQ